MLNFINHHISARFQLQDVQVLTSAEYFAQYWADAPVVSDLYNSIQESRQAASAEESPSHNSRGYKPHLSAHSLEQALNSGTTVQVCNAPYPFKCILPLSRAAADKNKTQRINSPSCKLQLSLSSVEVDTAADAPEGQFGVCSFTFVALFSAVPCYNRQNSPPNMLSPQSARPVQAASTPKRATTNANTKTCLHEQTDC